LGSSVEVVITSPISKPSFNYSWIAIVIFAVLAVGIGSYWGGLEQHRLKYGKRYLLIGLVMITPKN